ncbi:acetyltransferase-like isoleucine patch superfamily enzyme [Nocardioides luteus]|uniref:Acetyltransferase n=1 Tax=Nocardioides luteus TaxID=1844 RepID=A0ABQ5SRZ7_9ACTN|nr:hypothetical protein [Nocardioides luteus]MDR7311028.1 acetyltransferase-like isoleucine patch superfamily enzyme [Nocardioides luteus]GGR67705.1 hypothetical protein GCM10010197_38920 [Nocardioides luteus]GLJ66574.1 hypothetical protein GCM10017579_06100 [Nocardioides luteus]
MGEQRARLEAGEWYLDVWLGTSVTVAAGVRIGADTVIGAGSVVLSDIPAGVVAAGRPARVIRDVG